MSKLKFTGPARCFDREEDPLRRPAKTYKEGEVIVIRMKAAAAAPDAEISHHGSPDRQAWVARSPLITDGRFSGATRGFCIGMSAGSGGGRPIALLRDGDIIEIDADGGNT